MRRRSMIPIRSVGAVKARQPADVPVPSSIGLRCGAIRNLMRREKR
jgi:hypothetical protein